MSNVYVGQILLFGGNFAPRNFMFCNGQLLPISQYEALFALIGTTYGGNGQTNFALPNLQSQLPVHFGQGAGLANYVLGQTGGEQNVTITTSTMPQHRHMLNATTANASSPAIGTSLVPATPTQGTKPELYIAQGSGQPALTFHNMATAAVGPAGGTLPHSNLMPSLCVSFIIAVFGIYPSRS
jgi:microcystin-dependent protein